jgi:hypothetical protein
MKMPNYIMPKDLDAKPSEIAGASSGLSKGTETLKLVNELLQNGNKFIDGLQMVLNKKASQEGNVQLTNEQIEAKAHKQAQMILDNQKAQFSQEEIIMQPQAPKPASYRINIKTEQATKQLRELILKLEQKKTIGDYVKFDLAELDKMGVIDSAVEQFLIQNTELVQQ